MTTILPETISPLCAEWFINDTQLNNYVYETLNNKIPITITKLIVSYLKQENCPGIFGNERWRIHCMGKCAPSRWNKSWKKLEPEPPLPENMENIWQSECPIFPKKRIRETHLLVYIPKQIIFPVEGKKSLHMGNLTLSIFLQLFHSSKIYRDHCDEKHFAEILKKKIEKSGWFLMTRDIIPQSRNLSITDQQTLIAEISNKAKVKYEIPTVLEATICIGIRNIEYRDPIKNTIDMYPNELLNTNSRETRCKDFVEAEGVFPLRHFVVGDFTEIDFPRFRFPHYGELITVGTAAIRKLEEFKT